jgi:hypothetical protein
MYSRGGKLQARPDGRPWRTCGTGRSPRSPIFTPQTLTLSSKTTAASSSSSSSDVLFFFFGRFEFQPNHGMVLVKNF